MRSRIQLSSAAVFASALLCVSARAQEPAAVQPPTLEQRLDRLCEQIETQRQSLHIPGITIAIVKDDQVILKRGFGMRDRENQLQATPETLFAAGSTTKAFTAALCAMLVDEGKMNCDDHVRKHLPQFKLKDDEANERITIRDLLCHRSGLTRTDLLWASGKASAEQILQAVARAVPTEPFGKKFQYQNVMYMAAGLAVANAAGMEGDWHRLIAERLLKPLHMASSNTLVAVAQQSEHLAKGYQWDEEKSLFELKPMRDLSIIAPAGAINSNVIDMAQWLRFQMNRGEVDGVRLLAEERFDEMWSPHISLAGSAEGGTADHSYGLGWMLQKWRGKRVIEHGGNIDGFCAQVAFLPDEKIGYVLLANVSATPLQQMSINMVFEGLLGEWSEQPAEPLDPSSVRDYLGKYRVDMLNVEATVLMKDGKLAVDVPGQMVFALKQPDEVGKWFFEITDQIAVSFHRDESGAVNSMTFYQAGLAIECPKEGAEFPVEVSLPDAQQYLGVYEDEANNMKVTVLHRNGRLAVDVPNQTVYDLRLPDEHGKWVFRMTDTISVSFERDDAGTVVAMTFYQNGRVDRMPRLGAEALEHVPAVEELLGLRNESCGIGARSSLGNMRLSGKLHMPNQGIFDGTISIIARDFVHFVQHVDLGPFGWIKVGLDDARAWTHSSFNLAGPEELLAAVAASTRFQNPVLMIEDWKTLFDSIQVVRASQDGDRSLITLELKSKNTHACTAVVDGETGKLVSLQYSIVIPGVASIPNTLELSDWRDVKGVQFPYRWETKNILHGTTIIEITQIETNIDLSNDAFAMPSGR